MHKYLISVIASAVLAAISQTLAPEKWKKYLNAVTGIMIITVIASPVFELKNIDLFSEFSYSENIDEYAQKKAVCRELEKRVSQDAKDRLSQKFGGEFKVEVQLELNENFEIEGVKEMTVWTKEKREEIKVFLQEIYSVKKIFFQ